MYMTLYIDGLVQGRSISSASSTWHGGGFTPWDWLLGVHSSNAGPLFTKKTSSYQYRDSHY